MKTTWPLMTPPPELLRFVGEAQTGTRLYQAYGDEEAFRNWVDALSCYIQGGVVTPGVVSTYMGVSRVAVYKRLKKGGLTGFSFYMAQPVQLVLKRHKLKNRRPYVYVPVIECRAWRKALNARGDRDKRGKKT